MYIGWLSVLGMEGANQCAWDGSVCTSIGMRAAYLVRMWQAMASEGLLRAEVGCGRGFYWVAIHACLDD